PMDQREPRAALRRVYRERTAAPAEALDPTREVGGFRGQVGQRRPDRPQVRLVPSGRTGDRFEELADGRVEDVGRHGDILAQPDGADGQATITARWRTRPFDRRSARA